MTKNSTVTAIGRPRRERTAVLEPDVEDLPAPTGDPAPPARPGYNVLIALDVLRGLNRDTEALAKSLDLEIAEFPWGPGDGSDERRDSIERIAHLAAAVREAALKAVRSGDRIAREARPDRR